MSKEASPFLNLKPVPPEIRNVGVEAEKKKPKREPKRSRKTLP